MSRFSIFNIVGNRYVYFTISACVITVGIVAMIYSTLTYGSPIRLGIDFTGGSFMELRFEEPVEVAEVRDVFADQGFPDAWVQVADEGHTVIVRTKHLDNLAKASVQDTLTEEFGPFTELRFETVGPTIGQEVTRSGFLAILVSSVAILIFIIFAFRRVPNSFRYGVCAIAAMVHDILILFGVFSILGILFGWEADALILTAVLTVIGFSVQDTIVVFDRIRENTPKRRGESFETITNRSLLETLHRSLATQMNAMFVLLAIVLFGGDTMKQFVFVLLYGFLSGTYSSIFIAVPLLVVWENKEWKKPFGGGKRQAHASA